jgi:hypothetical protein
MNNNIIISIILIFSFFLKLLLSQFFNQINFPDATTYKTAGEQLFDSGLILKENIMPLYPILVYITENLFGIVLANIFISTISIYFAYKITYLIFKDNFSVLITTIWMAFHPFNSFYSFHSLLETFYVFLVLVSFYYLCKYSYTKASIFFVLTLLVKPLIEILAPFLIFLVSYFHQRNIYFSINKLLVYLIIYVSLMSPWWFHQYEKYGYFVRTNFGSSLVLYSGNNPLNQTGGGVIIDEKDIKKYPNRFNRELRDYSLETFKDEIGFKVVSENFPVYEGGKKAYLIRHNTLKNAALEFIKNNPVKFLELSVKKFKRFWSPVPFSQEFRSPLPIIISLFSLLPIYFFSFVGIFYLFKNKIYKFAPIAIYCLYINLIHTITISSFRYRFVIEMFLIILASYGLSQVFKKLNYRL